MANVIYMKDRLASPKRQAARHQPEAGETARILLFTGVRYERYQPETSPRTSGPKRARKP